MKLAAILVVCASCGFPRPPDLAMDAAPGDTVGPCHQDVDCPDAAQPICLSGQCLSSADACAAGGGARIVFISDRDGNPEVYRAYANGAAPVQLTSYDPPQSTTVVAPSPDGKAIAFIHDSDVFVVTVDGRDPVNLTKSVALEDQVQWSPDGMFLAIGTTDAGGTPGAYVMRNDGSLFTTLVGMGPPRDPSWWPDSSKVVFASTQVSAETDLWETPVSSPGQGSTSIVKLQMSGESLSAPRVAPSASAIAFLLTDSGGSSALVVPSFGGTAEPLTTSAIDHEIVWSHDSSRLAIVRGSGQNPTIYVVKADNTGLMSLTMGSHPRWSADDRYILFDTTRDGNREVYRMDGDGKNQVNLSNTPYDDFGAEWLSCSG